MRGPMSISQIKELSIILSNGKHATAMCNGKEYFSVFLDSGLFIDMKALGLTVIFAEEIKNP